MKPRAIWLISALILGVILTLFFWPIQKPLSPQVSFTPNLENKLQTRTISQRTLDFRESKIAKTTAPYYLAYNLDSGKVYLASSAAERIAPASFTKLLTGQVALDLALPHQLLTATKFSINKVPTILGLKEGEQLTLLDLLRASIATSANDAATTLAEAIATQNGLILTDYIRLMNQKATLLGMTASHFSNPDGLDDPDQYSTLTDIAKLVENTISNYPEIMKAAASDMDDIKITQTHGYYYLPNWNGLLGIYPGIYGLKIAYTENAGYSTIVLSKRGEQKIALILTGAETLLTRDLEAAKILDQAFQIEKIPPANITEVKLKAHYKIWNDLAAKIRKELSIL